MISFWISVVPPKMDRTLKSLGRALFIAAKAATPGAGCSRALGASAVWSRASSAARAGYGSAYGVVPSGLGGGFVSGLMLSSAGRVWVARAWFRLVGCGWLLGAWAGAGLGCRAGVPGWQPGRGGARQRSVAVAW